MACCSSAQRCQSCKCPGGHRALPQELAGPQAARECKASCSTGAKTSLEQCISDVGRADLLSGSAHSCGSSRCARLNDDEQMTGALPQSCHCPVPLSRRHLAQDVDCCGNIVLPAHSCAPAFMCCCLQGSIHA